MRIDLKLAIFRTGHSQRQIGRLTGISETRLSEIVRGWTNPSAREQADLAAALGSSAEALFNGPADAVATDRERTPAGASA